MTVLTNKGKPILDPTIHGKDLHVRQSPFAAHSEKTCFLCSRPFGEELVIAYDRLIALNGSGRYGSILMHPKCAYAMANRIIMDCWRRRRDMKLVDTNQ